MKKKQLEITSILLIVMFLLSSTFAGAVVTKAKKTTPKKATPVKNTIPVKKPAVVSNPAKDLQNSIKIKDAAISELQNEIVQKDSAISDLNDKIKELQDKLKNVTDNISNANSTEILTLNNTITDLKNQLASSAKDLSDTRAELDKTKKNLSDVSTELDKTNKDLSDTKTELDKTKKDLSDVSTALNTPVDSISGFKVLNDVPVNDISSTVEVSIPSLSQNNFESACLLKDGNIVPASYKADQDSLAIKPVDILDSGSIYNLNVYLKNGTKYAAKLISNEYQIVDNSKENVIEIPANPSKGFNYPYYMYIPANIKGLSERRIMLETANSSPSDDQNTFNENSKAYCMEGSYERRISKDLQIPFISPAIPRYMSYMTTSYPQFLTKSALTYTGDKTYRIDLQVKAMIEDAVKLLAANGIKSSDKVFINGTSSSGKFAERFSMLQPNNVMAVSAGGIAGLTILPLTEYKGTTLNYPIGIADYKQLTGTDFDSNAYNKIPQYLYMGAQDTNDATQWPDCFDAQDSQTIWDLFGKNQIPDRWNNIQDILKTAIPNAQCVTYANIGHAMDGRIIMDIERFYKANWDGQKLNAIIPNNN